MSWWLHAIPLSVAGDEALNWVRNEFPGAYGIPAQMSTSPPLPMVGQLIDAIRQADCHGSPWFSIEGENSPPIPTCPSPQTCALTDGLDLGEVSPTVKDGTRNGDVVRRTSTIEGIGFRGPSPAAVLRTIAILAASAGHFLILDDVIDHAFVLDPTDDPLRVAAAWPWSG